MICEGHLNSAYTPEIRRSFAGIPDTGIPDTHTRCAARLEFIAIRTPDLGETGSRTGNPGICGAAGGVFGRSF